MFLSIWTVVDIFQVNLFHKTSHEVDNAFFFTFTLSEHLIEHSVQFRSYAQLYACLLSFNFLCSTLRMGLPLFPFYRWTSWGLERVSDLAKKWQPVHGRGRIWTPLCVTPSEELVIRYEENRHIKGNINHLIKGPGLKKEYLSQLLLLLIKTTRESFLPKVGNLYELNKACNFFFSRHCRAVVIRKIFWRLSPVCHLLALFPC